MKNHSIRSSCGTGDLVASGNLNEIQLNVGGPDYVQSLMKNLGWEQKLTFPVLMAAFDLAGRALNREILVKETRNFFSQNAVIVPEGIETLPACWLQDVPNLLRRTLRPHWIHVPYMITRLSMVDGVLCMSFAQEMSLPRKSFSRWDELRATVNRTLRPNLWKELSDQEKAELCESYPELGSELLRLPSSAGAAIARVSDGECAHADHDNDY